MTPITPELLCELALGLLAPAEAAEVERQVAQSAALRRELRELRESLGLMPPPGPAKAPLRPLSSLLDHLDGRAPFAGFAGRFARIFQLPEAEALRLLAAATSPDPWEPFLPGASLRHFAPGPGLAGVPDMDAGFVQFDAGMQFPKHHHAGEEVTLVLQGGFADETLGRHFSPGDVIHLPPGSIHTFTIDRGEPCISAVLLLGALRFDV